ncbi:hypothetical protein EJ419_05315 [Alloscardovia theropitheci]|uniref:MucBP domain-containing protein n=1 Tax=Alloscardovia theropitheci TaxID=2496842 RepID=A0A4R0QRT0_9BIFI|nr:MucBP domain-containing protein [Alloscardovia theropitheci]TCD54078.1 hypothetical protein EJ419_05315 [Alloscardovia theropitheci]
MATYSVLAGPGQSTTPSNVREFLGYKYVRTGTAGDFTIGTDYLDKASAAMHVKILKRVTKADGSVVKTLLVADPTYTGTPNYTDASTTGFVKVLETNEMPIGTVNTNTTLNTSATTSDGRSLYVDNPGSPAQVSATAALPTSGQGDDDHNHVRVYGTDDAAGVANSPQIYLGFNGANPTVAPTFLRGDAKSIYVTYQTSPTDSATNVSIQLWNDLVRQTQTTYYYAAATGNVVVHYVDEDGNIIKNPVNDETNAPVNQSYDTEDKRETSITFNGETYDYVRPQANNTTGKVVEGTTDVTYIYKKRVPAKGSVVVHYVDEDDNVIKDPVNDETDVNVGTHYDTEVDNRPQTITKDGKTYTLVRSKENNTTGSVVEGTTHVTYVYKLVTGNVVVHYVDEDDNVIKNPVNDETNAPTGTNYDTEDKRETSITFNGETYDYVRPQANNTTGTVVEGTTDVTYIYKKRVPAKGSVIVHYVDEDDNVIKNPVNDETNVNVGTHYDTEDKRETTITFNGETYTYVRPQSNNTNGSVVEGTTDVTYIYRKQTVTPPAPSTGNVIVHYVDEDGNVIKNPENDETNTPVGTNYNTDDHKHNTITKDGTTYTFVKSKENNTTGTVTNGTINVTYIYRKDTPNTPVVPTNPQDKVTTIWITTTGKVLRPREDGTQPRRNFNDYRYVRTETDSKGNTTHIYEPVSTLARTGANVATMAAIAVAITVIGAGVVFFARRRKH